MHSHAVQFSEREKWSELLHPDCKGIAQSERQQVFLRQRELTQRRQQRQQQELQRIKSVR